ncbi:hypothetical protein EP837_03798 (plasmid) [Sphingobium sp. EP60837]|nr:hypothetical protein EP837_03798 [Sphingobium sp. EP60837]
MLCRFVCQIARSIISLMDTLAKSGNGYGDAVMIESADLLDRIAE